VSIVASAVFLQGKGNTDAIVAAQGTGSYGAQVYADLVLNSYSDCYLPSSYDLNYSRYNKTTLEAAAGFTAFQISSGNIVKTVLQSTTNLVRAVGYF
jgi:hypothetical protein